jgi:hypothetical protein
MPNNASCTGARSPVLNSAYTLGWNAVCCVLRAALLRTAISRRAFSCSAARTAARRLRSASSASRCLRTAMSRSVDGRTIVADAVEAIGRHCYVATFWRRDDVFGAIERFQLA